jgi:hypothetical protein
LVQTGLLPEEEGISQGPSPVSAGFTGNGEGEGDKAPPFTGTTWTDLPGEGAEIKVAADAAVPLEETTPDLKGEQTDGLRDRKPAGKTGLQTAAGPAAGGSGNAETLSVSWEGVKNFPTVKPEKEAPRENRVAEGRTRDRRRERLGLEVRDLRTLPSQPASELPLSVSGRTARGEAELLVELPAAGEDSSGERSSPETGGSRESFESLLARELRQDLSGDIVRSAQVILRDGGEGIIRLSLKPESLGNVKIRLEMAENKITGHIIVENDETLKAFEQELHSLEQAFLDAGFDGADLDTALASGNGQNGAGGERDRGEGDFFIPRQLAAAAYNALPEGGEEAGAGGNFGYGISQQINMLI